MSDDNFQALYPTLAFLYIRENQAFGKLLGYIKKEKKKFHQKQSNNYK